MTNEITRLPGETKMEFVARRARAQRDAVGGTVNEKASAEIRAILAERAPATPTQPTLQQPATEVTHRDVFAGVDPRNVCRGCGSFVDADSGGCCSSCGRDIY